MKIVPTKRFEKQIDEVYNFIALQSEKSAIVIYNHILDEIDRLATMPYIAAIEPALADLPNTLRSLIVKNTYKVIYWVDEEKNEVILLAVWDCRKNPDKIRNQVV